MNMMNKCAKLVQAVKKVKFNLARAIELSETAVLCTTLYRNLMQASNFGGTFGQLFLWIFMKFSQKMPLYFVYTMVQKSQKWPKTQIKGGVLHRALNLDFSSFMKSFKLQFYDVFLSRPMWRSILPKQHPAIFHHGRSSLKRAFSSFPSTIKVFPVWHGSCSCRRKKKKRFRDRKHFC